MNKKQILRQLESKIYARLAPSKHGVGVFAIRTIPKGVDPVKDVFKFKWVGFKPAEIEQLHAGVLKLLKDMCPLQDGRYWLPDFGLNAINPSWYFNHSRRPNLKAMGGGAYFLTTRVIEEGEELTVDYGTYDEGEIPCSRKKPY